MARSRNIKPGFFTNDVLGELPALTRLLFAGLWTICDREGRIEDRPKKIRAEVLPYDACDTEEMLQALEKAGFIARYEACGTRVIQVLAWDKHQNPHIKEAASTLPTQGTLTPSQEEAPDKNSASTRQAPDKAQPLPALAGLIPDSLLLIPDSGFLVTDSLIPDKEIQFEAPPAEDAPEHAAKAEKVKPAKIAKQAAPSADTWAAYESAYLARYGAKPVRNATVNGQLANLVNRLGADESPAVAAWYVGHRNQFYVSSGHSVGMLLRDCEKLRTEWATGRQATQTQAIQGDRTQSNLNAFSGLLSEAKQKEFNHAQH